MHEHYIKIDVELRNPTQQISRYMQTSGILVLTVY